MIDTIKLAVPCSQIKLTDYRGYSLSEEHLKKLIENGEDNFVNGHSTYIKNNVQSYAGYNPQVGISVYSHNEPMFYFTFSVPKLLAGNNLQEVSERNYYQVVKTLRSKLAIMGIIVSEKTIGEACVWTLHVGKNIDLTNKSSPTTVIDTLYKLHYDQRLSIGKTVYFGQEEKVKVNYRPGSLFSLYCKAYELCFYDKTAELKKDSFGSTLLCTQPMTHILRMEYRLFNAQNVQRYLSKAGIDPKITFKDLFQDKNFKKLNMYIWNKAIKPQTIWIQFLENDTEPLLDKMSLLHITGKTKLYVLAAYYLCKFEPQGLNILNQMFPPKSNVLARLKRKILQIDTYKNILMETFEYIEGSLVLNQPLLYI